MPPDRESTVLSAVSLALEQPAGNRHSFLAAQLRDDRDAQAEAASILNYETRETMFLQQPATRHFAPGECVDRFRIVGLLGSGGMGDVYEVEDPQNPEGRHRALKTIRADFASDPALANQFKREIHLGQTITHPNVCRIFDLGTHVAQDGSQILFLTMELLEGETLAQRLKAGPMTTAEALPIIRQVAHALAAAHERNVVHRDLKPGNIILVPASKGGPPRAVVTDFGLAVEAGDARDAVPIRRPSGTPDYMSPEQVQCGPIDCVSDIYSLAVVAYEMVSGKFPFHGERALYRMAERLRVPPVALAARCPGISPEWSAALTRALDRDASKRYQTVQELVAALERAERSSEADTVVIDPPRKGIRGRAGILAGAAVLIALGASIWSQRARIAALDNSSAEEQRVVVLPFDNLDGSESERVLINGITDTVVSNLTELEPLRGSLSIVPSSEIRQRNVRTVREANAMFGATWVITGSVQRTPGMLHVITGLVDARALKSMRSRDFTVSTDDPAAMQQTIVANIASILQIQISPQAAARQSQTAPASPAAYDYYLYGVGYLTQRDGEDSALAEFQKALQIDPSYALAHAGMCEAAWQKYHKTKDKSWIDKAWKSCDAAIHANPRLARPHVALSILDAGTGKSSEAEKQAREALRLDAGSDPARSALAAALVQEGRLQEAERELNMAITIRPSSAINYANLGTFYLRHAQYQKAAQQFQRVADLVPNNPGAYNNLGASLIELGKTDQAERVLEKSVAVKPTYNALSNLGTIKFQKGEYANAAQSFEAALALNAKDYETWGNLGDALRWTPDGAAKAKEAYRKAIELTKAELDVNPKDASALSAQGIYRAKSGDPKAGLRYARLATRQPDPASNVLYEATVIAELAHRRDESLGYLSEALRLGLAKRDVEKDPELRDLRNDQRYLKLVTGR